MPVDIFRTVNHKKIPLGKSKGDFAGPRTPKGWSACAPGKPALHKHNSTSVRFCQPLVAAWRRPVGRSPKSALRSPRAPSGGGRGGGGQQGRAPQLSAAALAVRSAARVHAAQPKARGARTRQKAGVSPLAPPGRRRCAPKPEGRRRGDPAARGKTTLQGRSFIASTACGACNSRSPCSWAARGLPVCGKAVRP